MQAEPFSGVTVPLDVEAIAADPVEAGERGVELFAEILREAGAVALNEPIFGAVPLSQDVDGVVELRRPDSGQETGIQEVIDQLLAGGRHRRFICRGQTVRSHVSSCLTPARAFASSRAEALDSMIIDAREYVGEPSLWIDIVELGGRDEGLDRRGAPAALIGAGEGSVSSSHGDGP